MFSRLGWMLGDVYGGEVNCFGVKEVTLVV